MIDDRIADDAGDELEHGEPDFPGQFDELEHGALDEPGQGRAASQQAVWDVLVARERAKGGDAFTRAFWDLPVLRARDFKAFETMEPEAVALFVEDVLGRRGERAPDEPGQGPEDREGVLPRTEAGKALLGRFYRLDPTSNEAINGRARFLADILAIEAEALTPDRSRVEPSYQYQAEALRRALDECRQHHADTVAGLDPHTGPEDRSRVEGLDAFRSAEGEARTEHDYWWDMGYRAGATGEGQSPDQPLGFEERHVTTDSQLRAAMTPELEATIASIVERYGGALHALGDCDYTRGYEAALAGGCRRGTNTRQGIDRHWCLTHNAVWLLNEPACDTAETGGEER